MTTDQLFFSHSTDHLIVFIQPKRAQIKGPAGLSNKTLYMGCHCQSALLALYGKAYKLQARLHITVG
jgi:hypothetical protein